MKAILASVLMGLVAVAAAAQTPRVYGRLTHRMETAKVKSLNKDLLTFSPLPGGPDITVKVGADTRLTKDNKPAHLKDIKAGNYVRVMFPIGEGTVTAQTLPCGMKRTFRHGSKKNPGVRSYRDRRDR